MKTASFPAVVEARKAATGQLVYYKSMMADTSKQVKPPKAAAASNKKPSGK